MLYAVVQLQKSCLSLCNRIDYSMPGFPVLHYLMEIVLKKLSTVSMMPSNHLILCHPLLGDSASQHTPCLVSKEVLVTKAFSEFQKSYLIRVVRKCQSKGKQSSKKK